MLYDKRVILIVMDSIGAGAMPDANIYGDEGSFTINHIEENYPMNIPNLCHLGLNRINGIKISHNEEEVIASYGRAAESSAGKDTITGHWEITGIITETPFQTFTDTGFPESFIQELEERIGTKVIGNFAASGTEIIKDLGEEHRKTGYPIVYTSADSVFQIAANIDIIPLERLYEICSIAREMLVGDLLTGRVIARPFIVKDGEYIRTGDRHDYALNPPRDTILNLISEQGKEVCAVGKIKDIYNGSGITASISTKNNNEGIDATINFMNECKNGLIFTNLVDFDSLYGHRRNPIGYGKAIEEFDGRIPDIISNMKDDDILIMCADHGNDPTFKGWNHTREYIPVIIYGKHISKNTDLGTLNSFADIGATICEYLEVENTCEGTSFLKNVLI